MKALRKDTRSGRLSSKPTRDTLSQCRIDKKYLHNFLVSLSIINEKVFGDH